MRMLMLSFAPPRMTIHSMLKLRLIQELNSNKHSNNTP